MNDPTPRSPEAWVSVDDRLPDFWHHVLATLVSYSGNSDIIPPFVCAVTLENVKDRTWVYTGSGGAGADGGYLRVSGYRVTHWMPYPRPAL